VKDEERMLPGCLESLRPYADEIIVVDTGSKDRTAKLAAEAGCTVFHLPWPGSFAKARNAALARASGRWVLSIDADERLMGSPGLRRMLRATPPRVGAYSVAQHNVVRVSGTGQREVHPVDVLRLFRRHPRLRFEGDIHERVDDSVRASGLSLRASNLGLLHLTYELPPGYVELKQARYLRMLHRALRQDAADGWARFQRGKTLMGMGRYPAALRDLWAVAGDGAVERSIRALALDYLGIHAYEHGQPEAALDCAAQSLALVPDQSFAWFVRAQAHFKQQAWREALGAFSRMRVAGAPAGTRRPLSGDLALTRAQRAFHRGRCLLAMGRVDAAARELERGLHLSPDDAPCHLGLAYVARLRRDSRGVRHHLREAIRLDEGWKTPRELLARWGKRSG
jgi:tetratricopeptide (TPR) repeat protein